MTHRYYGSTGGSGSCPWSTTRRRRLEDAGELFDVTLQVAEEHPFDDGPDGHLAERRMRAEPLEVGIGDCAQTDHGRVRLGGDPVEQLTRGEQPVAPDRLDPVRVGLHPPKGHRFAKPVEDPLDLADPVRQHLGDMGEELWRVPARLGLCAEVLARGPRRAGLDRRSERLEPVVRLDESIGEEGASHVASFT